MNSRVVAVVQARTSSTRMPRKVLQPLAGKPLLTRLLERVAAARSLSEIVVATTTDVADDPIRTIARNFGVPCFSGHPTDLLDRHCRAGALYDADYVVKIPSDCPLIDPAVIDRVVNIFLSEGVDYASNLHPPSYPDGNDVEVMPWEVLEEAWREATEDFEREHTTPFIWEKPSRYRLHNVAWERGLDYSMSHRFTIDYPEDYQLIRSVFDALWTPEGPCFGLDAILEYLDSHPDVHRLNEKFCGVNWYRHHPGRLKTIDPSLTRAPQERGAIE